MLENIVLCCCGSRGKNNGSTASMEKRRDGNLSGRRVHYQKNDKKNHSQNRSPSKEWENYERLESYRSDDELMEYGLS